MMDQRVFTTNRETALTRYQRLEDISEDLLQSASTHNLTIDVTPEMTSSQRYEDGSVEVGWKTVLRVVFRPGTGVEDFLDEFCQSIEPDLRKVKQLSESHDGRITQKYCLY